MDIVDWIWERVSADDSLDEPTKLLVLAAVDGEEEFSEYVGGIKQSPGVPAADPVVPSRAYLASLEVEGYRGIGTHAQLTFNPGPGLVVVAGRNGSGKSSFAEALDWALSQSTSRAHKTTALWQEQWRNLHHPQPTAIRATFMVEGQGRTTVGLDWPTGADWHGFKSWIQPAGHQRSDGTAQLGWAKPLELYSPMLSYDELGGILESRPSELYDALEHFLGLERLTDASKRLHERTRLLDEPGRSAVGAATRAKEALGTLDDGRARIALKVLAIRKPAPDAVAELEQALAGSPAGADPTLASMESLAAYTMPEPSLLAAALDELDDSRTELDQSVNAAAEAHQERTELLLAALRYHESHGEEPCPVCGSGSLDAEWRRRVTADVEAGRAITQTLAAARHRDREAKDAWQSALPHRPTHLDNPDLQLNGLAEAGTAWTAWQAATGGTLQSERGVLISAYGLLTAHMAAVTAAAAQEVAQRQGRWLEVLPVVTEWLGLHKRATAVAGDLAIAKFAENWLKSKSLELRNERLQPLADQARGIWSKLRQESNVDLGSVTLEGTATRRHVDLRGSVDGTAVGTLAVMSQGELHALGLALFIPRACAEESPFGFLVLDDPIQAMDPSKIDGLVDVLTEIAKTRQVIVFSHDDRLPDCLRRSSVPARILEIVRGQHSEVEVRSISDPVDRYLSDARAITKDEGVNDADKRRVIPGLCRMALEAACKDIVYSRQLGQGASRGEVENEWNNRLTTSKRIQGALDRDHLGVDAWLASRGKAKLGLGICTSGLHGGLSGIDPGEAVAAVQTLISDLRASA